MEELYFHCSLSVCVFVCVCLCVCVCLSVHLSGFAYEQNSSLTDAFLDAVFAKRSDPIEFDDLGSKVKVTVT